MLELLIDTILICLPLYGLYSQLILIKKQKSMGSFSIYITAIYILCNILKIFFWFSVGFALSLLIQAALVVALALCVLYECVKLTNYKSEGKMLKEFWKWSSFQMYLDFIAFFCLVLVPLTILSRLEDFKVIGETIGLVASVIEIGTGVPIVLEIFQKRSAKGVSMTMIGVWTFSDIFKTVYFLLKNQPFQFIMTSVCCMILDLTIALEMVVFGDGPKQKESVKQPVKQSVKEMEEVKKVK